MPWSRLMPGPAADLDDDALRALYVHPGPAPGRPAWVRANMVASFDGAATDSDGRTSGLSSPADRQLLVILRRAADVVLVGAETVRAQRYRASPTTIAVLTRTGDLDATIPLFAPAADGDRTDRAVDHARPLVLTTPDVPADRLGALARGADVVPVGPTAADAVRALAGRGLTRVLTEGGPRLLAALAADDQLDEFCLTLSGQLVGSTAVRVTDGPPLGPVALEPLSVLAHDHDLYLRHRIVRSTPGRGGVPD